MNFKLTTENGIAILTIDNDSKPNLIDRKFLFDLKVKLLEIETMSDIYGVIITGTPESGFLAGMDIKQISQVQTYMEVQELCNLAHSVFSKLSNLKNGIPTIALINGACLGGGYELALSCKYRIAVEGKYAIGLPEVNLGIIPAFGGCSKLPTLVGFRKAIDIICGGKQVDPHKACAMGLVDTVCPTLDQAFTVATECINTNKFHIKKYQQTFWDRFIGRKIWYYFAKREILKKTKGLYPAPISALDTIYSRFEVTEAESLYTETAKVADLLLQSESPAKNLLWAHMNQESHKKTYASRSEKMRCFAKKDDVNVGIVGAGFMGGAIAQTAAYKNKTVKIKDISEKALELANSTINELTSNLLSKKLINEAKQKDILGKINKGLTYDGFENSEIVIEAVIERMDVKRKVIAELDSIVPDDCIIATNTSSLSVTEIAKQSKRPERVVGLHFFSPVHKMPLVEIVPGELTSPETIERTFRFAVQLGKIPVVCMKDTPCFIVNRILGAYMNEALWCLADGYPVEKVDEAVRKFGMPVGPFELMDEVGIPVVNEVGKRLVECYPSVFHDPKILPMMISSQLNGKRSPKQEGFYCYASFRKVPSKEIGGIIAQIGGKPKLKSTSEKVILERLLYAMQREAYAVLHDGIATNDDVNLAMVIGAGYPIYRQRLVR